MTVNELIKKLEKIEDKEQVVLIFDEYGWANIEKIDESNGNTVRLYCEQNPIFSDN